MNLKSLPTPELLKQIGKDPRSYVIFVFAGLLWYFVFKWTGAADSIHQNCETERIELKKELAIERKLNYDMIQSDRNRSDSIQRELAQQLDSLLRDRLEYKTKENLQHADR